MRGLFAIATILFFSFIRNKVIKKDFILEVYPIFQSSLFSGSSGSSRSSRTLLLPLLDTASAIPEPRQHIFHEKARFLNQEYILTIDRLDYHVNLCHRDRYGQHRAMPSFGTHPPQFQRPLCSLPIFADILSWAQLSGSSRYQIKLSSALPMPSRNRLAANEPSIDEVMAPLSELPTSEIASWWKLALRRSDSLSIGQFG